MQTDENINRFDDLMAKAMIDNALREEIKKNPVFVAEKYQLNDKEKTELLNIQPERLDEIAADVSKTLGNAVYELCDGRCQ